MNRAPTILLIGAIQVGKMFVTAVVLMAAILGECFAPRFRAFGIEPVPVSPLRASIAFAGAC